MAGRGEVGWGERGSAPPKQTCEILLRKSQPDLGLCYAKSNQSAFDTQKPTLCFANANQTGLGGSFIFGVGSKADTLSIF